tara:strand:+ start:6240 stop:6656 length:417 start_codon:yes stop_codon:yes gene_type:complete
MKIGFTGTRHGTTNEQKKSFHLLFQKTLKKATEFHHGDCVGSDKETHNIVDTNFLVTKIVVHPPSYNKFRANCKGDIILQPLPYIERNHNIVDETDILIATPDTPEKLHSGTWATIRYARKQNKDIYIIKTGGKIEKE